MLNQNVMMVRSSRSQNVKLFNAILLFSTAFCAWSLPLDGLTRCPPGTSFCGLRTCTPAGAKCFQGSCFDVSGKQIACMPAKPAWGEGSCPWGTFCDANKQCQPETCLYRQQYWCPEDKGALNVVKCTYKLDHTVCFASSSGNFTCNVSAGVLAVTCSKQRVAAGMAAAAEHWHPEKAVVLQHSGINQVASPSSSISVLSAARQVIGRLLPSWAVRRSSDATTSSSRSSKRGAGSSGDTSTAHGASSVALYRRKRLLQRHRRALLQLNLWPSDFTASTAPGRDPNYPVGEGMRWEFVDGFLSSILQNSQATQRIEKEFIGPSFGGPIPVSGFSPVVNPAGNLIQTGGNPGGTFIKLGPGGAALGTYGGGWSGPYNARTGTYGNGGSYGFAAPYFGQAQGTAIFAVQNATVWQNKGYPTISYPCPLGQPIGTPISVGIPCGVAMVSLPASQLPTTGGLPAGPLLPVRLSGQRQWLCKRCSC